MYRIKIAIIFFITSFVSYGSVTAQLLWNEYTPQQTIASFKVECTEELSFKSDTIETEVGKLLVESFYAKDPLDSTYIYSIVAMVYPEGFLSEGESVDDDMLSHMIEGSAQEMLGRVVYSSDISTKAVAAKLYRLGYQNDEKSIKGRVMRYNDIIFNVQIASLTENILNDRIDRFLDSFMILPKD